jgi:hypothetical protein
VRVLVLGGSRVLDPLYLTMDPDLRGTPEEMIAAHDILIPAVGELVSGDIILTGGCPYSVDRWALEMVCDVRRHGVEVELCEYHTDGTQRFAGPFTGKQWQSVTAHPQERDRHVVSRAVGFAERGYDVSGLFIEAAWSPTRGASFAHKTMGECELPSTLRRIVRSA